MSGERLELASTSTVRIRLTKQVLRELRLALLGYGSPFSVELELVEETHDNGDVVVRLARPDRPLNGERILGAYRGARLDWHRFHSEAQSELD